MNGIRTVAIKVKVAIIAAIKVQMKAIKLRSFSAIYSIAIQEMQ